MHRKLIEWIFCVCILCLVERSWEQLNLDANPYRPLLDQSKDYVSVSAEDISLEYKIDKMPSRTYDWSYVAAGINLVHEQFWCIEQRLGGRHTCAIKSGIGWADGVNYNDRLFCFGRNQEGQLDPPVALSTASWETV